MMHSCRCCKADIGTAAHGLIMSVQTGEWYCTSRVVAVVHLGRVGPMDDTFARSAD